MKEKTSVDELVDLIESICIKIDKITENERKYAWELRLELERYERELNRTACNIKQLSNLYGE